MTVLRCHIMQHLTMLLSACLCISSAAAQQPPDSAAYAVASTDSATVARFITRLQHLTAINDSLTIASLIDYQHNVGLWDGRSLRHYSTRAQFLRAYRLIFDQRLKHEIATVTADSLFANYQGVMFNSGRVWVFPDAHGQLLIITINKPVRRLPTHTQGPPPVAWRVKNAEVV